MTIVEFLEARYAEAEKAVYDADSDGNYRIAWLTLRNPDRSMRYTTVASDHRDEYWVADGELQVDYAKARVVFDARQVLADIKAKRRIIDEVFEVAARIDGEWGCCHNAAEIRQGTRCHGEKAAQPFLKLLALPYAEHQDYQEEWRP